MSRSTTQPKYPISAINNNFCRRNTGNKGAGQLGKYNLFLFDADGTLFDFERAEGVALEQTLTNFGINCDDEIRRAYHRINSALWQAYERGEVDQKGLGRGRFARLMKELGSGLDGETLNNFYLTALSHGAYLLDGALEVCNALYGRGRLALVTNGMSLAQHGRFDRSAVKPYFEAIFVSQDTGYQKPQTGYFDYVFEHLGVTDRSKSIIIGDSLSSDIRGGNNAGIDTCWFNPEGLELSSDIRCTYQVKSLEELPGILLG